MNPTVFAQVLMEPPFSILDPLMGEWHHAIFERVCIEERGQNYSQPQTPSHLHPAWISTITGRSPGNHGVLTSIWAEERKRNVYFTLYNFRDIACETIWSIVSRQNARLVLSNFPMMSPPSHQFQGASFLDWYLGSICAVTYIHSDLYQAKGLPGFNARRLAWDF